MRRAFKIAHDPPSGPVFVALPINVMEQQTEIQALAAGALYRAPPPDPEGVAAVARHLLAAQEPAIMIGDDVARAGAGEALVALAETVGAGIWTELNPSAPASAQHAPELPGPHPVRPRQHREGLRRRRPGAHGGRPLLRGSLVRAGRTVSARCDGAPNRGVDGTPRPQPRARRGPDRRAQACAGGDLRAGAGGALRRLRRRGRGAKPGLRHVSRGGAEGSPRRPRRHPGAQAHAGAGDAGGAGGGGTGGRDRRRGGDHRQPGDPQGLQLRRRRGLFSAAAAAGSARGSRARSA